jgi:hypothetical protein
MKNLAEVSADFDSLSSLADYMKSAAFRVNANIANWAVKHTEVVAGWVIPMDHAELIISPQLNYVYPECGGEIVQKEPIRLNKKFQRGAMIGDDFVAIGATDGTLMFFKLDFKNNSLTELSTNNIHKGCINEIWDEQSEYTYVASSDGIVTAWGHSANGPQLKQTYELPEEILFVCSTPSKHIIACGKRIVYFVNSTTGEIVKQEKVEEDITGIFGNILAYGKCRLATLNKYYNVLYSEIDNIHYHGNLLHEITVDNGGIQNPNFWITPDSSFRGQVYPDEVVFLNENENRIFIRYTHPHETKFDSRRNLLKFSPVKYWVSVSTGTNIITYDIETSNIISSLSPRVSRSEIDARKFPVCNSLWYGIKADFMFGLYSNDTLYWWHLKGILPTDRVALNLPQ